MDIWDKIAAAIALACCVVGFVCAFNVPIEKK